MINSHKENISGQVTGRFAPTPSGPLHFGSLVTALGSYLMTKRAGGRWLLRIEDIDQRRTVPGIADEILRTLEILGFNWDGPVIYQSRRNSFYQTAIDYLIKEGMAYPCSCTRAEIAIIAPASNYGIIYPATCRDGLGAGKTKRAYRIKTYDDLISFQDGIIGSFSQKLSASTGDFIIQRADGPFAYHMTVVIDDDESGVNQVVRGANLLCSTPNQIYLQKLLKHETPTYYHLPLVLGPDGTKLSKRNNALSLTKGRDLRRDGGRLIADALKFLGQNPPTKLISASCPEILAWAVDHFNPNLVPTTSAEFPHPA